MIDYSPVIAASLEFFPEKPSSCRNEQVYQGEANNVKRLERSNGLDTALCKNYLFATKKKRKLLTS